MTKYLSCTWNKLYDSKETKRRSRKLWRKGCHATFKLKIMRQKFIQKQNKTYRMRNEK
jgi:hypothetical protein